MGENHFFCKGHDTLLQTKLPCGHHSPFGRILGGSVYLVGDGLCDAVPMNAWLLPVGFADEKYHTGCDADEEAEGRTQTQSRHLRNVITR